MFVNFTNHISTAWSPEQIDAASLFGEIIDIPFPSVPPEASEEEIRTLSEKNCSEILKTLNEVKENANTEEPDNKKNMNVVHVMGEMTLTFAVVSQLKEKGITCIASTTKREVTTLPDGSKVSTFQFVRFRKY